MSGAAPPRATLPTSAQLHRLLEVGDGAVLRATIAEFGIDLLRDHVNRFGPRLSRRSRRFWETLLDLPRQDAPALSAAIWPLAQ